jgi:hypothetical protein
MTDSWRLTVSVIANPAAAIIRRAHRPGRSENPKNTTPRFRNFRQSRAGYAPQGVALPGPCSVSALLVGEHLPGHVLGQHDLVVSPCASVRSSPLGMCVGNAASAGRLSSRAIASGVRSEGWCRSGLLSFRCDSRAACQAVVGHESPGRTLASPFASPTCRVDVTRRAEPPRRTPGEEQDAPRGRSRVLLLPQHGYSRARGRGLEHGFGGARPRGFYDSDG